MSVLQDVRTVLLNALTSIPGIHIEPTWPESIDPPVIIIDLNQSNPIEYHATGGVDGVSTIHFALHLLFSEALIRDRLVDLDNYLMPQDDNSVKNALETITPQALTSATLDWIIVKSVAKYGSTNVNGSPYIGVQFAVDVEVS